MLIFETKSNSFLTTKLEIPQLKTLFMQILKKNIPRHSPFSEPILVE